VGAVAFGNTTSHTSPNDIGLLQINVQSECYRSSQMETAASCAAAKEKTAVPHVALLLVLPRKITSLSARVSSQVQDI